MAVHTGVHFPAILSTGPRKSKKTAGVAVAGSVPVADPVALSSDFAHGVNKAGQPTVICKEHNKRKRNRMQTNLYETIPHIKDYIAREAPGSVLVVSLSARKYVRMLRDLTGENIAVDKIDLADDATADYAGQTLHPAECLTGGAGLPGYDLVFVAEVFENLPTEVSFSVLDALLAAAGQAVFVLLPVISADPGEEGSPLRRVYHPTVFRRYDFSYALCPTVGGDMQMYTFFPHKERAPYVPPRPVAPRGPTKKLRIGYALPHKLLTGGMKCLLEQMRQLHRRGHTVYALCPGQPGESALPEWSDLDAQRDLDGQFLLTSAEDVGKLAGLVDVVMVGYVSLLPDFIRALRVPLVYWEQGYEGLYGEHGKLLDSHSPTLQNMRALYGLPFHCLAVADVVAEVLYHKYGVKARLLYNGIDLNAYHPLAGKAYTGTVLLVGNPSLPFKNFPFALQVLSAAWAQGHRFRVKWACQVPPKLPELPFPIETFVMLPQGKLAELYRSSDVFLFTSVYESFPMPPMEAMASGVPVIATDCGGILTYGKPGENLLLVDQGDVASAAAALGFLLGSEAARAQLAQNGLNTAQQYGFDTIAETLENLFLDILAK